MVSGQHLFQTSQLRMKIGSYLSLNLVFTCTEPAGYGPLAEDQGTEQNRTPGRERRKRYLTRKQAEDSKVRNTGGLQKLTVVS